ncbi:MAG: hypothetical protein U5L75_00905 [Candidatus Campbellbacteria bacterium]|nr:hypothetical protein [Candidatus Campbellbacteria bacterium]
MKALTTKFLLYTFIAATCVVAVYFFAFSALADTATIESKVKIGICGNNVREGTEECDGLNLGGRTCKKMGFEEGLLYCNSDCTINTSQCTGESEPEGSSGSGNGTIDIFGFGMNRPTESETAIDDNGEGITQQWERGYDFPFVTEEIERYINPNLKINTDANTESEEISHFFQTAPLDIPTLRNNSSERYVERHNDPLSLPKDHSGLLVRSDSPTLGREVPEDGFRAIIVKIPEEATKERAVTVDALIPEENAIEQILNVHTPTSDLSLVENGLFRVEAIDSNGASIQSFDNPIEITLFVPTLRPLADRENVGAYYLNNNTKDWDKVSDVTFGARTATFSVDHLTYFALFESGAKSGAEQVSPDTTKEQDNFLLIIVTILLLLICLSIYLFVKFRL